MKLASSLYKGGELIDASEADYEYSKELGMICPFCKEAVFLAREHTRKNSNVRAAWRHYRVSEQSAFCEERALTVQGKEILKQLQPEAHGQRLKLFNRRFWEIYRYEKDVPPLDKATSQIFDNKTLNLLIKHCRDRWDIPAIMKIIPGRIEAIAETVEKRGTELVPMLNSVGLGRLTFAEQQDVLKTAENSLNYFADLKFSLLRHKILSEVIEWLPTETASASFRKVIQLAIVDCREISEQSSKLTIASLHSSAIANMAVSSLILTDWEEAITSLKEPLKGLGFAKS
jgi:hypothetical protein